MKKIGILLIALMIISVGFMTGCTQQNEENYKFIKWTETTTDDIETQLAYLGDIWAEEDWDNCLYHIVLAQNKISNYTSQANNFTLEGKLDLAKNQFINWLNAYRRVYDKWGSAVQNFIVGDNTTGNSQAQEGQNLLENTKIFADNYKRYMSEWKNE